MLEFTGERVIPGQVDADLWNEHFCRYLFAARLARGKRVADLGCGAGYGAAELAKTASSVAGFDIAPEAVEFAASEYRIPTLSFHIASAESIPEPDGAFDLVVSFEVIEHLEDSEALVREARRLVSNNGQFVVSTPNRDYYAESRSESGPNPFHVREFTLEEFRELLSRHFPYVKLFTQNHAAVLAIRPLDEPAGQPVVRTNGDPQAGVAHFFLAVCALSPQVGSPTFLYVPTTANVLRERERHIQKLQGFLDQSLREHAGLMEQHHNLEEELKGVQSWLAKREEELADKVRHVEILQKEVAGKSEDLSKALAQLHSTEQELASRTEWARQLSQQKDELDSTLSAVRESRWLKLGRKLGLGPDLRP